MNLQTLIVAGIVSGSAAYAAWSLMPGAWRRPLARRLLGWPGLGRRAWLQRAARPAGGCGCDACDGPPPPLPGAPAGTQVIRIQRRQTQIR